MGLAGWCWLVFPFDGSGRKDTEPVVSGCPSSVTFPDTIASFSPCPPPHPATAKTAPPVSSAARYQPDCRLRNVMDLASEKERGGDRPSAGAESRSPKDQTDGAGASGQGNDLASLVGGHGAVGPQGDRIGDELHGAVRQNKLDAAWVLALEAVKVSPVRPGDPAAVRPGVGRDGAGERGVHRHGPGITF